MSGARRIWLIRLVVGLLLAADVVLLGASMRLQEGNGSHRPWLWLPLALIVGNAPYVAALTSSALLFRKFSAALWLVSVAVILVGAASLYLRLADYSIACQAWEARQAGTHFMCCAPPGRLVALFVDYIGLGCTGGLAGLITLASTLVNQHMAALRNSCQV